MKTYENIIKTYENNIETYKSNMKSYEYNMGPGFCYSVLPSRFPLLNKHYCFASGKVKENSKPKVFN